MINLQSLKRKRNARVDQNGTPPANFLNTGDIAVDTNAGGWLIDFTQEEKTKLYYPYSILSVNNACSSDFNVYINQDTENPKICRANDVLKISDRPGIRSVRISKRNSSVTVLAGEVEVNVERPPLSDNEFRRRQQSQNPIIKLIKNRLGL